MAERAGNVVSTPWWKRVMRRSVQPALRRRGVILFCAVLAGGGLFLAIRQVDAVLGRMSAIGGEQGSGLGFPWDPERVVAFRDSWRRYVGDPSYSQELVRSPAELHGWLLVLDISFAVTYTAALMIVFCSVVRFLEPTVGGADDVGSAAVRPKVLRWLPWAPLALFLVDVVEDVLLWLTYGPGALSFGWFGPAVTVVKWALAAALVGALVVGVVAAACDQRVRHLRKAVAGARGVLGVLAVLIALLLLLSIGAQQVDDVIRAWTLRPAGWATFWAVLAAVAVAGVTREVTITKSEHLQPDSGDDPQTLLLVAAGLTLVAGIVVNIIWHAWGLIVPGFLLLVIWALSLAVKPGAERAVPKAEPTAERTAGEQLARALGVTVCFVLVWVLVRAAAFDLLVRNESRPWSWLIELSVVAMFVTMTGAAIARSTAQSWFTGRWVWVAGSLLAFAALWGSFVLGEEASLAVPFALGSVAVIMTGVAAAAGAVGGLAMAARGNWTLRRKLPAIFRLLRLQRFPVIAFVLVWTLLVALIDQGGFHDLRRTAAPGTGPAPSLGHAYRIWLGDRPDQYTRPMVIVAAQGGGIRAAVWTALVMECVFGPTPVRGGDGICAGNVRSQVEEREQVRQRRLPLFLASGASGGSVGLAAWSARRLDIAELDGTESNAPRDIDDVLRDDYVAPDIARLLSGDALYMLLAHRGRDRADVIERAWENSWSPDRGGLSRGLRASFALANGPDQPWRMPLLVLNGSQVEDGCRFVVSPVDMVLRRQPGVALTGADDHPDDATCGTGAGAADPAVFDALPRTTELVDYLCPDRDVRLSTAAHVSARFPYVSPVARVPSGCEGPGLMPSGVVSYVTDGGFADNSGAATAIQLWRALQPMATAAESNGTCVLPLFLQIDNSLADESGNTTTRPPPELIAPGQALMNQFNGQEAGERAEARQAFPTLRTAQGRPVGDGAVAWFRIAPSVQPGIEPPLGWTLAPDTVADMRQQMLSPSNRRSLDSLRQLLAAPPRCPSSSGS
jgi:hypothetical protein